MWMTIRQKWKITDQALCKSIQREAASNLQEEAIGFYQHKEILPAPILPALLSGRARDRRRTFLRDAAQRGLLASVGSKRVWDQMVDMSIHDVSGVVGWCLGAYSEVENTYVFFERVSS